MKRIDLSHGWLLASGQKVEEASALCDEREATEWLRLQDTETVQAAMVRTGRVTRPFLDDNFKAFEEFEEGSWWYRLEFDVPVDCRESDRFEIEFGGILFFSTIWLNGGLVGYTRNAHHAHRFDVTGLVRREGRNVLVVECSLGLPWLRRNVRPDVSANEKDIRPYARIPQMIFGWDFAPRVPLIGLWRPVSLLCHGRVSLEDIHVRTESAGEDSADVEIWLEVGGPGDDPPLLRTTIEEEGRVVWEEERTVTRGVNRIRLTLDSPRLWFPQPAGEPFLYNLVASLVVGGVEVDREKISFGVRTVGLEREGEFTFVVNGRRVFAKGANWVPADSLELEASPEGYEHLLAMARDAGFNMIRVWGGGIYESELFYELCDRYGIMVWQDFMYACAMYPDDDPVFMESAEREAVEVVRRLRRHPSVVLWCGNNECQEAWVLGDWPERAPRHLGERLYDHLLPKVVGVMSPGTPYWPGSPYGGPTTRSLEIGDYHDWYSLPKWRTYDENAPRFSSEYGFRSVPQRETVDQMISPGYSWSPESQDEMWRLKGGADGWTRSILPEFGSPGTLEDYIMLTQELQATLMRYAIEVYRRRMFATSGSLIWQYDEPWPGATFALVDYFGRAKAAYYWVGRAYQPVIGLFHRSGDRTSFWAVSDLPEEREFEAVLRRFNHSGELLGEERISGRLPANRSVRLVENLPEELLIGNPAAEFLHSRLRAGDLVSERFYHQGNRSDWLLSETEIEACRQREGENLVITVRSSGYAHFVTLTTEDPLALFSDNFFDLLPGEERSVAIRTAGEEEVVIWAANSKKRVLVPP